MIIVSFMWHEDRNRFNVHLCHHYDTYYYFHPIYLESTLASKKNKGAKPKVPMGAGLGMGVFWAACVVGRLRECFGL
eukprot:12956400-Alexandrium_andersonii.AAC.1